MQAHGIFKERIQRQSIKFYVGIDIQRQIDMVMKRQSEGEKKGQRKGNYHQMCETAKINERVSG
jgi:hypothetical protein